MKRTKIMIALSILLILCFCTILTYASEAVEGTKDSFGAESISEEITDDRSLAVVIESGICGNNATWTLDSDGVLWISGTGAMYDYGSAAQGTPPWYKYNSYDPNVAFQIKSVVIGEGITHIGAYAFVANYTTYGSIEHVSFPVSVTSIGASAFRNCSRLTTVSLPANLKELGSLAFHSCSGLQSVVIPTGINYIPAKTFGGCTNIAHIFYLGTQAQWKGVIIEDNNGTLGEASVHFTVTYDISKAEISLSYTSAIYSGTAKTPDVIVSYNGITLQEGTDYTVSYNNNINAGTAAAIVTGIGSYTGTKQADFTISPKAITPDVTLIKTFYKYDGKAKKPPVIVKYDGTVLAIANYQVTYSNNTKEGTATVTVSMRNNYSGSLTLNFYIIGTGWQNVGDNWYYMEDSGELTTGWMKDNGKWYYLDKSGVMQTGWLLDDGKWYYLNKGGAMQTTWKKINGLWYYFNSSGVMQTGWITIDGKWYYLNSDGDMHTGWMKYSGKWYYLNSGGAMQTGFKKISGLYYYFNSAGEMQTGWIKDEGKWYYLNKNGVMQTGWLKYDGFYYYLNTGGAMQIGGKKIDDNWYYFKSSGVMATGWQKVDGKRYYFKSSGAMAEGWQKIDDKWYYFNPYGVMVTGTQTIDGKEYIFDSDGVCKGETTDSNETIRNQLLGNWTGLAAGSYMEITKNIIIITEYYEGTDSDAKRYTYFTYSISKQNDKYVLSIVPETTGSAWSLFYDPEQPGKLFPDGNFSSAFYYAKVVE